MSTATQTRTRLRIPTEISTEQAVTAFGIIGGLGGGIASIIAGRRLSRHAEDTIRVTKLIPAYLLNAAATAIAPLLIPVVT